MKILTTIVLLATAAMSAMAQSADWQSVIWREPQVRYLLRAYLLDTRYPSWFPLA